jgi:hypothetical protein
MYIQRYYISPHLVISQVEEMWDLNGGKDDDYAFYHAHFVGREHLNFLSASVEALGGEPMAVSIVRMGDMYCALV